MTRQFPSMAAAGFLADPAVDEQVERLYADDMALQGYVARLTRVWAHAPESLAVLSYVLKRSVDTAGLDVRARSLLVAASASALGDSYCSLAFGTKLASVAGNDLAASVLTGSDEGMTDAERALATWARQVVTDPNAVTMADVDALRDVGYSDRQVFAITLFVALRLAFSTVNDALGAAPDAELVDLAPAAVRASVTWGRPPSRDRWPR